MPDKLYEYAVVRVVPRVEREEFLNIGVILFCKNQQFLELKFNLNEEKLNTFSSEMDVQELQENLQSWQQICAGEKDSGMIGAMTIASRFRWITATRSSVLQTSKVHSGLCEDARKTLERLFEELVL